MEKKVLYGVFDKDGIAVPGRGFSSTKKSIWEFWFFDVIKREPDPYALMRFIQERGLRGFKILPATIMQTSEHTKLVGALTEISETSCGIPGHMVAVGCGSPSKAYGALHDLQQNR